MSSSVPAHSSSGSHQYRRTRSTPPKITLHHNGGAREFHLNPTIAGCLLGFCVILVVALLTSTGYLFLRDDLANATLIRQAKLQHLYEDRISKLRAKVDLATSRQMLDQQAVERRVRRLLLRQEEIGAKQHKVSQIFNRNGPIAAPSEITSLERQSNDARKQNTSTATPQTVETINGGSPIPGLRLGALVGSSNPFATHQPSRERIDQAYVNVDILDSVERSLLQTEQLQIAEIRKIKKAADRKVEKLASILSKQGIKLPNQDAIGGPLIELKGGVDLSQSISALDASLTMLDKMRSAANSFPHGSPSPGTRISSRYGNRKDPFTGRSAVHSGLDFSARRGTPVHATATGTITKAGRKGGYGKLIEIDHGDGITTRYAHLSKIRVKIGQRVAKGKVIGNVGSTGRSTGPHLHYEVRRGGRAMNPLTFVRLEKSLRPYL
ncbi:MAG: M23 family metallopeptidase [Rhizobiaceae bacterium]